MLCEWCRTIPVTLVKEFEWCPAIPWIIANYGAEPWVTPSMEAGKRWRRSVDLEELANRLSLPKPRRYEVFVASRKLGLHGYIDIVAGTKPITVAEIKAFNARRWRHFRTQLIAYAALANAEIAPVRRAVLVMGTRAIDITVTDRDIHNLRNTVEKIRKIIESPEPPPVNQHPNKCSYCTYRKHCPYQP